MLLHVGLLVEPLSAVLARVRARVRVDQEVRGQGGAALERLAALLARERLLVVVHGPGNKVEKQSGNRVKHFSQKKNRTKCVKKPDIVLPSPCSD